MNKVKLNYYVAVYKDNTRPIHLVFVSKNDSNAQNVHLRNSNLSASARFILDAKGNIVIKGELPKEWDINSFGLDDAYNLIKTSGIVPRAKGRVEGTIEVTLKDIENKGVGSNMNNNANINITNLIKTKLDKLIDDVLLGNVVLGKNSPLYPHIQSIFGNVNDIDTKNDCDSNCDSRVNELEEELKKANKRIEYAKESYKQQRYLINNQNKIIQNQKEEIKKLNDTIADYLNIIQDLQNRIDSLSNNNVDVEDISDICNEDINYDISINEMDIQIDTENITVTREEVEVEVDASNECFSSYFNDMLLNDIEDNTVDEKQSIDSMANSVDTSSLFFGDAIISRMENEFSDLLLNLKVCYSINNNSKTIDTIKNIISIAVTIMNNSNGNNICLIKEEELFKLALGVQDNKTYNAVKEILSSQVESDIDRLECTNKDKFLASFDVIVKELDSMLDKVLMK